MTVVTLASHRAAPPVPGVYASTHPTHTPNARTFAHRLHHKPIGQSWSDGHRFNSAQARYIVDNLATWATQLEHPDASQLTAALDDLEKLLIHAWTTCNEATFALSLGDVAGAVQGLERWLARPLADLYAAQQTAVPSCVAKPVRSRSAGNQVGA